MQKQYKAMKKTFHIVVGESERELWKRKKAVENLRDREKLRMGRRGERRRAVEHK